MNTKKCVVVTFVMATLFASAYEVHVDCHARTNGDGSPTCPFMTIEEARNAVRNVRAEGALGRFERVDVIFAPGDYRIEKTLRLEFCDGGINEEAPVVWRAACPGTVRFVGGVRLPREVFGKITDESVLGRLPEESRGKVVVADVKKLFHGRIPDLNEHFGSVPNGPLLYANCRHLPLARWPNEGFTSFSQVVDHGALVGNSPIDPSLSVFSPGAFLYSDPRAKRWRFEDGVWLAGYWTHDWDFHSVRAASYGMENGTNDVLRLASGVPYGVMNGTWGGHSGRRFYVFNLLEELDSPGEWYLDRRRGLLYLCLPDGGSAALDDVYLGTLEDRMVCGEVRHFRLQDISFCYTLGDGLNLKGEDIRVIRCRVECIGKRGISISGVRNLVQDSEICQCGTVGVAVSGGDRCRLVRSENMVEMCDIHDFGIY